MNILFINNFRGRGGGEEFLRDLLPGLIDKGANVGLVCRPDTPLVDMFRGTRVQLYPIDRSGIRGLFSLIQIAGIIKGGGYSIVNAQRGHDLIQAWLASVLSASRSTRVYTVQVPEFKRSRCLLGRMHAVIAVSRYIREQISRFAPALAPRVAVINYGIDISSFQQGEAPRGEIRRRFQLSPDIKIIGTVGDLWKNQIEFLDALQEIRKHWPDARYAIVASEAGIGQVQAFKDRAESLGLTDAVVWVGRLSKEDMRSFYADIDLAVTTHRNEGFGIWTLEALAMGKPVVAFDAGGLRDPLEGCPAGVLVGGDAQHMAIEIIGILRDGERDKRMAEAGPAWVAEKFSRQRMVEEYYEFFKGLAS